MMVVEPPHMADRVPVSKFVGASSFAAGEVGSSRWTSQSMPHGIT
jgi:hypothetical protein